MPPKFRKQFSCGIRCARKNEHHIRMSAIPGKEDRLSFRGTHAEVANYVAFCRVTIRRRGGAPGNLSLQHGTSQFSKAPFGVSLYDIIALVLVWAPSVILTHS